MRFGLLIAAVVLASAAVCPANTLIDPFGQSQANCNLSGSSPYGDCDVVGDPQLFDIHSATFSIGGDTATLMIYLNSGAVKTVNNKLTLGSFVDGGITLIPGDVFFYNPNAVYDPSDPATTQYLKYGLALTNHGSFVAGNLYSITRSTSVETAQQALNDPSAYYRKNQAVLMTGSGTPVSTGTVSVANNGNGTTGAQYVVTLTFPTTSGFLSLLSNNQMGMLFSSADCGNDVIQGTFSQTPEPASALMMMAGLALLVVGRTWRKRRP